MLRLGPICVDPLLSRTPGARPLPPAGTLPRPPGTSGSSYVCCGPSLDYFPPPGLYRASFDKKAPISELHSQGFPRNCTQPLLNWAPHPIRTSLLTQETSPHSEIPLFTRESSGPLERAPSPPTSPGPLPAPEGPASIPYTRAEIRRPGDCGVQCEGPRYPAL